STEGAPCTDRQMPDLSRRGPQQPAERPGQRRVLDGQVAGARADMHPLRACLDSREVRDIVDVDEPLGPGEAEVHHGDEALAACQHLALVRVLGQFGHRLRESRGAYVVEDARFHQISLPSYNPYTSVRRSARGV